MQKTSADSPKLDELSSRNVDSSFVFILIPFLWYYDVLAESRKIGKEKNREEALMAYDEAFDWPAKEKNI